MTDQYKELRGYAKQWRDFDWAKQALQLLDEMEAIGAGGVSGKASVALEPGVLQPFGNTAVLQGWVNLINQADDETKAILRMGLKEEIERMFPESAERVEPVADDGWIEWSGGGMPVPLGVKVDVRHRSGLTYLNCSAGVANSYAETWWHTECPMDFDIIAYRIVK